MNTYYEIRIEILAREGGEPSVMKIHSQTLGSAFETAVSMLTVLPTTNWNTVEALITEWNQEDPNSPSKLSRQWSLKSL